MAKSIKTSAKKGIKQSTRVTNENRLLVWAIVLVVLLIVMAVSLTYAYFDRNITQNGEDPLTTIETAKLDINFETSEYITNVDATLINDTEAYTLADKTIFSVKRSEDNTVKEVYYTLNLVDINITDNLKSSYLKWRLYETTNVTATTEPLNSGDFAQIENNTIKLYNTKIPLAETATDEFVLLIWLSNDENKNQTELLKGSLNAKVEITAVNVND